MVRTVCSGGEELDHTDSDEGKISKALIKFPELIAKNIATGAMISLVPKILGEVRN